MGAQASSWPAPLFQEPCVGIPHKNALVGCLVGCSLGSSNHASASIQSCLPVSRSKILSCHCEWLMLFCGSRVQVGGASHLGANHSGMFETSFLGITSTLFPAHAACCRWGSPLATAGVLHTQVSRNALINTLPVKL